MKFKKLISFIVLIAIVISYVYYKQDWKSSRDVAAPTINFSEGLLLSIRDTKDKMLTGVSASDDIDGDVTNTLLVENHGKITKDNIVTITYAAYDKSNNVSKATREVKFVDYSLPQFSLREPLIFTTLKENDLFDAIQAVDARGNDISSKIRVTYRETQTNMNRVDGSYPITFAVTDELGGTRNITLNLDMVEKIDKYSAPVINLKEYLVHIPLNKKVLLSDYIKNITYQGKKQKINYKDLVIDTDLDIEKPGVYEVYYRYHVSNSNEGMTKLVVVVE